MKIKQVLSYLEEKFPLYLKEDWDNSGIQIGDLDEEVTGIMISLDLDEEVIKKSIISDCNLIINHHPLIFSPIKSIDLSKTYNKNIKMLIKENISVYAMHTNLDKAKGGVNDNLAKILGIDKVKNLDVYNKYPLARYGDIKKIKASLFAEKVKESLKCKKIILYGDMDKEISKIGLCGGAGSEFIEDAIKKDLDLIITSDVKYHEALDHYRDIVIIDPGHFASENHVIYMLKDILENKFAIKVRTYSHEEKFRNFI